MGFNEISIAAIGAEITITISISETNIFYVDGKKLSPVQNLTLQYWPRVLAISHFGVGFMAPHNTYIYIMDKEI